MHSDLEVPISRTNFSPHPEHIFALLVRPEIVSKTARYVDTFEIHRNSFTPDNLMCI